MLLKKDLLRLFKLELWKADHSVLRTFSLAVFSGDKRTSAILKGSVRSMSVPPAIVRLRIPGELYPTDKKQKKASFTFN